MTHAFAMVGRPDVFWLGVLVYIRVFTCESGFLPSKNMHIWLVGDSKLPHHVSVCVDVVRLPFSGLVTCFVGRIPFAR